MTTFWIVTGSIGCAATMVTFLITLGPKAWRFVRGLVHLADDVAHIRREMDPATAGGLRAAVDTYRVAAGDVDERLEAVEALQPAEALAAARGRARARRARAMVPA